MGNPTTGGRLKATPNRLIAWTAAIVLLTAALLAALTVTVADTDRGIGTVGGEAAPQAQVASDLYFALSDLDSQTARTLLTIGDPALAGPALDAGQTINDRIAEISADLRRAIGGTADPRAQADFQTVLEDLARYQSLAGRAVVLDEQSPDAKPGEPAPTALAYYSQATDLMHAGNGILATAADLRSAFAAELASSADRQHSTAVRDTVIDAVLGAALLGTLAVFQGVLRRRFRRGFSPLLATATLATLVLLAAGITMATQQANRVRDTVHADMAPYLAIQRARTVAYDATGDAIRFVVAPDFGYDLKYKATSGSLTGKDGGENLLATALADQDTARAHAVTSAWTDVSGDEDLAMGKVGTDLAGAVAISTGIARHQTAFDFYLFDSRLAALAAERQDSFSTAMAAARSGSSGWTGLPAAVLGAVAVLVVAGVRPRLAEYRR